MYVERDFVLLAARTVRTLHITYINTLTVTLRPLHLLVENLLLHGLGLATPAGPDNKDTTNFVSSQKAYKRLRICSEWMTF